ncbi:ribose-phosphate diphosphokinase [Pseudogulbenkiania ferrooxidans]|uniref:Ribose-phosphate pyrophosphokinase n=1 Tax=Pseudogulbenkiania ferrooxidans 2002 TaxID=279714 RepID=B9Z000_9NEIS|nr:ribose-phosphate diphosphokinase [Pseudogulbenkiania ferrooxidans]EEG09883.1 ribose-phosphate pyrophosphokinase [Pseudogulbenkiania ferrooxidans 2002]
MKTVLLPLPGNEAMAAALLAQPALAGQAERGELMVRSFPDGETHLQLLSEVDGARVVLVATLDRPDGKLLPLLFAAALVRDYGAAEVGLLAPYLAYMRQDTRFHPGEGVTARYFAETLSPRLDWLVTVDPHLHRIARLEQVYRCATCVVHAAPAMAEWIAANVPKPLLIGPDQESQQWVAEVAALAQAPYLVLSKTRHGDRQVEVSRPDMTRLSGRTPVLVDDIVSTAHTMAETLQQLRQLGANPAVCVAVHAIFTEGAVELLNGAGAAQVVSCNTVVHSSNAIALERWLAEAIQNMGTR